MVKKTYKVYAEYVVYLEHIVMADSEDAAWKYAQDLDGGLFKQVSTDDWTITDVEEIKQ